jgi:hypothetical protein
MAHYSTKPARGALLFTLRDRRLIESECRSRAGAFGLVSTTRVGYRPSVAANDETSP